MTENLNLSLDPVQGPHGAPPRPAATDSSAGAPAGSWRSLASFTGKGGEYFFILLRNFFFSILTLGIYSFWGKVRSRAYLWRSTVVLGEPLEYTGTGKELFISFLMVIPFVLLLGAVNIGLTAVHPVLGPLVIFFLLFFCLHFASYRAVRYRLTRTRWRGIRGNLTGSATSYAFKAMGYTLAALCTLGILGPWALSRTMSLKLDNVVIGNRKVSFSGPVKDLYVAYFTVFLATVLLLGGYLLWLFLVVKIQSPQARHMGEGGIISIVGGYVIVLVGILLMGCIFHAAFTRWLFRYLTFGPMRTRSTITVSSLLAVRLTNILLVTFTLGFGFAWAMMREMRLFTNTTEYQGDPALGSLGQDTLAAPARGEGFLEALDVDLAL